MARELINRSGRSSCGWGAQLPPSDDMPKAANLEPQNLPLNAADPKQILTVKAPLPAGYYDTSDD